MKEDLILVMEVFILVVAAAVVVNKLIQRNCLMHFLVEVPVVDVVLDEAPIYRCMFDCLLRKPSLVPKRTYT